ncbi:hypothetical protein GCM10009092_23550 [Bowmanella denitrificans]|uniref:RDD domain-containing protein n=1 Tax=Bowmanella denitrificans TaxID=366582 RepID=A0ABN0X9G8_9ALTE
MNEKPDPLLQDWQSQQVELPDLADLKAKWRKNRIRQWTWVVLDWLSVVLMGVVYFYLDLDHWFKQAWFIAMFVFTLGAAAWNTWLRRLSLFSSRGNLTDHLHRLRAQSINNIRLARLTQGALVFLLVCFALYLVGIWLVDAPPWESFRIKLLRSILFLSFMSLLAWWWAIRLLRKARQQLDWLESIQRGQF